MFLFYMWPANLLVVVLTMIVTVYYSSIRPPTTSVVKLPSNNALDNEPDAAEDIPIYQQHHFYDYISFTVMFFWLTTMELALTGTFWTTYGDNLLFADYPRAGQPPTADVYSYAIAKSQWRSLNAMCVFMFALVLYGFLSLFKREISPVHTKAYRTQTTAIDHLRVQQRR